mmetsp:Transcript_43419/g.120691  ORF Transcript_43419/g.120691 Transcript_43419/m.120691 type:complete len:94 (-) Transcript_43419:172-453(-)
MCGTGTCNRLCSCLCAYFIPPLGVYWRFGCGLEILLCFILTLCGYVPGIIYAACVIGCNNPADGRELAGERSDLCGHPAKVSPEGPGYVALPQ